MKARIVRVGNSRGIRLPKALLDRAGLPGEVEVVTEPGRLVIEAGTRPQAGWAEAARAMAECGDAALLVPPVREPGWADRARPATRGRP